MRSDDFQCKKIRTVFQSRKNNKLYSGYSLYSPVLQTRSPTRFCSTGYPSFFQASCASRSAPTHTLHQLADNVCCYQTQSVQRCTPCAQSHMRSSFPTRCHCPTPPRKMLAPFGAVLWGAPPELVCQWRLKDKVNSPGKEAAYFSSLYALQIVNVLFRSLHNLFWLLLQVGKEDGWLLWGKEGGGGGGGCYSVRCKPVPGVQKVGRRAKKTAMPTNNKSEETGERRREKTSPQSLLVFFSCPRFFFRTHHNSRRLPTIWTLETGYLDAGL